MFTSRVQECRRRIKGNSKVKKPQQNTKPKPSKPTPKQQQKTQPTELQWLSAYSRFQRVTVGHLPEWYLQVVEGVRRLFLFKAVEMHLYNLQINIQILGVHAKIFFY